MTDGERLLRDVFPAEVFWPELSEKPIPCRVFVTTHRVIAHVEANGMTAKWTESMLIAEPPEADRGTLFGQIHLDTADGPVHISRGRGCGCHSMLKLVERPVDW